jgi:tRNA (adenine57-N1/adenine58-N1)-methyltransferase
LSEVIKEGDDVLLLLDRKKTFLVKANKDKILHTHKGFITLENLLGEKFGTGIRSNLSVEFKALRPTIRDYIFKMNRRTQIIYPKDIALIIVNCNIHSGCHIVEAGTGTGALTAALAFYVQPSGHVFSYETRDDHIETALRNITRANLSEFVDIKNKDISEGIDERELDAVVLDLATPWQIVNHAYVALKGSGMFASFSPTIDQTLKTTIALRETGFVDINTIECLVRRIRVEIGKTRPETLMTGHTGYLTFGRKAN